MNQDNKVVVRVIASARTWIEGDAVQQLETTARLPGMRAAIGMPDLHPGKGSPIGAAFVCEGHLYPHLVGNDIGCGMGLWQTDLLRRKLKRDRWADRLDDLDERWDGDVGAAAGERLAAEDREILTLRDLEGLPGDETASMLGLTLPAMKSRLHRARLALAVEVREEMRHAAR